MRWWKVRRRSTALVDSVRPSKVKFSLVAVGDGDEQEANGRGPLAFEQEVAEGVEVALGLGHLLAFDEQEADMHPMAGEGLAGGAFGLGDLVLVMREHQVFAAGVEVEGVAEDISWPWRSTRCASRGGRGRARCPRLFAGL